MAIALLCMLSTTSISLFQFTVVVVVHEYACCVVEHVHSIPVLVVELAHVLHIGVIGRPPPYELELLFGDVA